MFRVITSYSIHYTKLYEICGSEMGVAIAVTSGGNGGYSYDWSNDGNTIQINNLISGYYDVVVTDALGCSASGTTYVGMQGNIELVISEMNARNNFV